MQNKKLSSIYVKALWIIILASIILLIFLNLYLLEKINTEKEENIRRIENQIHTQKDILDEGMTLMFNNIYLQRSFLEDIVNDQQRGYNNQIWDKFTYEQELDVSSLDKHINEIETYFGNIIINGNIENKDKDSLKEIENLKDFFKFQHYLNLNSLFESWSSFYSEKGYITLYPFGEVRENIDNKEEVFEAIKTSVDQLNNIDDPAVIKNGWDTSIFYDNTMSIIMFSKNLPIKNSGRIEGIITNSIEANHISKYININDSMIDIYVIDASRNLVYKDGEKVNTIEAFGSLLNTKYSISDIKEVVKAENTIKVKDNYIFTAPLENVSWKLFFITDSKYINSMLTNKIIFIILLDTLLISIIVILIFILRKNNQELNKLDKLKDEFLLTISHDLKVPLSSILGFTEMIKTKFNRDILTNMPEDIPCNTLKAANKINRNLSIIQKEGERLTGMINNLLDLTKLESGEIKLEQEWIYPSALLEDILFKMSTLIEKKGLKYKSKIQPDLPKIFIDREMIKQVLENLISNAVKFTDQGTITCVLERKDSNIIFTVADTGIGISQISQQVIFDKFVKSHIPYGNKIEGNGLGLAICKNILKLHKGEIWVNSVLEKGSSFSFSIPLKY